MILFLFIALFDPFANSVDIHDQIGQCTNDSEHFGSINERFVVPSDAVIVAGIERLRKMSESDRVPTGGGPPPPAAQAYA